MTLEFKNHRELFEEIEKLDYIYDDLKRQENEYKNKLTFPEKNLSIDYNKEDIDEEFKKFKNHIQTVFYIFYCIKSFSIFNFTTIKIKFQSLSVLGKAKITLNLSKKKQK